MKEPLHLFEAFGIEIETMLVDVSTLQVRPICDEVLEVEAGAPTNEVATGAIAWSNELAAHVIELKTNGPTPRIDDIIAEAFAADVRRIEAIARARGARVLPTAMHPTMDPARESVLWSHEGRDTYRTYHRVFDCKGHGWTNLQSCHLNLPFGSDDEFGILHAAVRAVLPLLPSLAASSPFVEGKFDGTLDRRLAVYVQNQKRVPSVIGEVIPEPFYTEEDYIRGILEGMFEDIAPLDPEGELQYEWLNSRGAIARFDRSAIEIRVLDAQETPWADLAHARLVVALLRALVEERWVDRARLEELPTTALRSVFDRGIRDAETAMIELPELLQALGRGTRAIRADVLWQEIYDECAGEESDRLDAFLRARLQKGSLATRIVRAVGESPAREALHEVYAALGDCAVESRLFDG